MGLAAGTHLGPYHVLSLIGSGGMGEVYRAHDTRLHRDVAIKVLLAEVADDPDRLARFKREAQVLASLNHPNIAQIHGLEEAAEIRALVMELVEGPTLADRIARGAIPLDEALPIAKQIAEALESAHEQGIVHRDLKPANIKVRDDGTVKVLDFGLAKALEQGMAAGDRGPGTHGGLPTASPTITSPALTMHGVILGTAAYMSPEQAKGRAAGPRADVWAFGCVLFEMLTGSRAFSGEDVTDTIVAVLSKEPDWQRLPASAAVARPLLARCLKKDSKQRLQAIGDARLQIDDIIRGTTDPPAAAAIPTTARLGAWWAVAAAAGGALLAALAMWALMRPVPRDVARPSRFEIVPRPEQFLSIQPADRNVAISPDGQHIVYRGGPRDQLVVRSLDRIEARALEDTANARSPFFSPDGQWVGFFDGVTLKKVSIAGGPAITICPSQIPRGADWGEDGTIVFATSDTANGLLRVSAGGGEPTVLTRPDPGQGERDHFAPSLLPDGRGVFFTIFPSSAAAPLQIAVLDFRTGQRKALIRGGSQPQYVETGHLVYAAGRSLTAVRFDLDRLELQSDPVLLGEDVLRPVDAAAANYAVSRSGALVHVPARTVDSPGSLVWVDRTGRSAPTGAPPHIYAGPRLSPDGTRVAVTVADRQDDLHVLDLKKGTLLRLAQSPAVESSPVWTRDGQRLVFASNRDGRSNLYAQAADGTGTVERLTNAPDEQLPAWVAPERTGILGSEISPKTAGDIVWFPIQDSARQTLAGLASSETPRRLVETLGIDYFPEVSPNGRFIAYQSNEWGRSEIYVRPFPGVDEGVWHVSVNGGLKPVWARNGRELFYLDPGHALFAIPVETSGTTFGFGRPSKLFDTSVDTSGTPRDYDVAADGRFLMVERRMSANQRQQTLVVVLNWFEELKARLPAGR